MPVSGAHPCIFEQAMTKVQRIEQETRHIRFLAYRHGKVRWACVVLSKDNGHLSPVLCRLRGCSLSLLLIDNSGMNIHKHRMTGSSELHQLLNPNSHRGRKEGRGHTSFWHPNNTPRYKLAQLRNSLQWPSLAGVGVVPRRGSYQAPQLVTVEANSRYPRTWRPP
jgi:hypothetical protein